MATASKEAIEKLITARHEVEMILARADHSGLADARESLRYAEEEVRRELDASAARIRNCAGGNSQ